MAKLFDRILAECLKEFALEKNCLPIYQFGMPGKNTTQAIEFLVNHVHRSWLLGLIVTVFGLDLSGAYDRVNADKLLQILLDYGVPKLWIKLIQSFLSDRLADVILPGEAKSQSKGERYTRG